MSKCNVIAVVHAPNSTQDRLESWILLGQAPVPRDSYRDRDSDRDTVRDGKETEWDTVIKTGTDKYIFEETETVTKEFKGQGFSDIVMGQGNSTSRLTKEDVLFLKANTRYNEETIEVITTK